MNYEFSLAHLTVLDCAPPEMIYIADMCGYDYVGIRPIYLGLSDEPNYNLAKNSELLEQTKRALRDTEIEIHDIELAKIDENRDMEDYEPAMKISSQLGAKRVISSIWTDDEEIYLRKFKKLCDIAEDYDLTVELEFVTWASVKYLKETVEVLEKADRKNAGLLIDTLHFHRSRVNLQDLETVPDEWFNFVHLCDGPGKLPSIDDEEELIKTGRDERLYIGEGGINIDGILQRIPDDVVYSLELPHLERVSELGYAEHARRCLESAKEYLFE